LAQIIGTLGETESSESIVATQLDNQVGGLMIIQQPGQAL
jgi:hypothetical protein